jgi:DNA-binding response OmpR family regulator
MATPEKTILIVDDDADFRDSVTVVLEAQGYKVTGAKSAKEALASVASSRPDLVVLDIMMECDSSGYEVNQAIKFREEFQIARDVPILMVSSIPLDPAARFDRAAEVEMITPDSYMTKPLNFKAFLEKVENLLLLHEQKGTLEAQTLAP